LTNIYTSTSIHIPFDAVAFSFASRVGGGWSLSGVIWYGIARWAGGNWCWLLKAAFSTIRSHYAPPKAMWQCTAEKRGKSKTSSVVRSKIFGKIQ